MVDVDALFNGKSRAGLHCYLKWDRASALADFIVRRAGSLEVPISFEVPNVTSLPDTMPSHPRKHDCYYADGGTHWPNRLVVSV